MKETLLSRYERESTLWKNANALYKATDWVKMECLFVDMSDYRTSVFRAIDRDGNDVTDTVYADRYVVRLTNKSGRNVKDYTFSTKEEANAFFKEIMSNKILKNFKRVM